MNRAFAIEMSRTMQQDIGFGIRQIVDIALRALSPGVNDPTTAQECIVHLGAISYEILRRDLPSLEIAGKDGRQVILSRQLSHADFVASAFDEIRQSAASLPSVGAGLVETLAESSPISARTGSSIAIARTRSSGRPGWSSPGSRRPVRCRRTLSACETLLRLSQTTSAPVTPQTPVKGCGRRPTPPIPLA